MTSIQAHMNFEDLGQAQNKLSEKPKRSQSLNYKKTTEEPAVVDEFFKASVEDILSTSSGISNYFRHQNEVQECTSVYQRKRGVAVNGDFNEELKNFKNLSMDFSDFSQSEFTLEAKSKKGVVMLPSAPFKVLDVPGIEDDYYTNLLSWSYYDQIAVSLENTVYLFDYRTADAEPFYEAYKLEKVISLTFDYFGEKLAMGNVLGQVSIWDVEKKKEITCIDKHIDRVSCLDWSEKGLLSGSKDKNAFWYDLRMKKLVVNKFQGHTQEICGIKWNSDLTRFATGGNDNKANAWDIKSNKPIMEMKHRAGVKALCWSTNSPDILITGGGLADRTIKSWNVAKEKMMFSRDIEGQVCAMIYSQLTNDVITAKGNPQNDIEVWRSNGFKKVGNLLGHTERPLYLAWSPDGTVLLSVSSDETMRFWQLYKNKHKDISVSYDDSCSYDYDE